MPEKQTHPVRNGIIATVAGGMILSMIPSLRGYFRNAISWGWSGVIWLWHALISHYSVPIWLLLIVGFLAFVGLIRLFAVSFVIPSQEKSSFLNYTEDLLYGAKWRWSWARNKITDLWCFCPICDAQLVPFDGSGETHFLCERCPPLESDPNQFGRVVVIRPGNRDYVVGSAEREILRRIRTGDNVASST